jgi:hypothetical protein
VSHPDLYMTAAVGIADWGEARQGTDLYLACCCMGHRRCEPVNGALRNDRERYRELFHQVIDNILRLDLLEEYAVVHAFDEEALPITRS